MDDKAKNHKARIERLTYLLEDSPVWELPGWPAPSTAIDTRKTSIALWLNGPAPQDGRPWTSLALAIDEVESGSVLGSPTRCAVCDGPPAASGEPDHKHGLIDGVRWHRCDRCVPKVAGCVEEPKSIDTCIRAILRARKRLRRKDSFVQITSAQPLKEVGKMKVLGIVSEERGACVACGNAYADLRHIDPANAGGDLVYLCADCADVRDVMLKRLAPGAAERWLISAVEQQTRKLLDVEMVCRMVAERKECEAEKNRT